MSVNNALELASPVLWGFGIGIVLIIFTVLVLPIACNLSLRYFDWVDRKFDKEPK